MKTTFVRSTIAFGAVVIGASIGLPAHQAQSTPPSSSQVRGTAPTPTQPANPDEPTDAVVERVHKATLTIDPHIDIRNDFNTPAKDPSTDTDDQFDLPKLERGGLDVATIALFADPARRTPANVTAARRQVEAKLDALTRFVNAHPDRLAFAKTAADLERIPALGKHAILLSFLNALPLGQDLAGIERYQQAGVRVFGFTHAGNNDFADSSRPNAGFGDRPDEAGGLTPLGRKAVPLLNRLGVIIDISQLTPAGVRQTLQLTKAPVIASHSAVRGRVNATRNLTNDELRGIAASGGVVHIVTFAAYLRNSPEITAAYQAKVLDPFGLRPGEDPRAKLDAPTFERYQANYRAYSSQGWRNASLVDWLDAVDYAVRLVGIDHDGLSSDFNHGGGVVGYANVGDGPNVTRELLKRGYSEADIAKLWGGNFLRVFKQVEAVAASLRTSETASVSTGQPR
jgi:membrane dipeptidase